MKKSYKHEKRRMAKKVTSALLDPAVIILSSWLKVSLDLFLLCCSPAAGVFLRFPKASQHPACTDDAILNGKAFGIPLIVARTLLPQICPFTKTLRGRLHGALSIPGIELSPANWVEIFCDYMDDFNLGVEILYVSDIDSRK
jgi:hypothetical protein